MKIQWFLLCFYLSSTYASHAVRVSTFCENYHQRAYCILRLQKIVNFVIKNHRKHSLLSLNKEGFSNSLIQQCAQEIQEKKSLSPFKKLWENIKHYKYLEDQNLIKEFTKLLFRIQHSMLHHSSIQKKQAPFDINFSLEGTTYTEAITIRSYYAQRLAAKFQYLHDVICTPSAFFDEQENNCNCHFVSHYTFQNKDIIECVSQMEKTQKLTPLLSLAKEFANYKLILNDIFLKEFIHITFIAFRNLYINNINLQKPLIQKSFTQFITNIYNNLDNLPLEEILEAIDLLHDELPPILEKYEFNSKISWKKWLRKYWWLPPALGVVVGIQLYLISKGKTPVRPFNNNPFAGDFFSGGLGSNLNNPPL